MQTTKIELKVQISTLVQKATNTDEAEKNESDLDLPAELERRQVKLAAIVAAKARFEERQPRDKDGKPKAVNHVRTDMIPTRT